MQRPNVDPFASDADRQSWRDHVEEGWWRRIVHARASAEIATSIFPHLTAKGLAPWTRDFLMVVWINSMDRVVMTDVDVLWRRDDVHSFETLKNDLQGRCQGSSWATWGTHLDAVLKEARTSETFVKAKLARDRLSAYSSTDPLRGVTDYDDLRLTMSDVLKLQDLTEEVFGRFPEGLSWGVRAAVAVHYPELVERVVNGDLAGLPGASA